MTNWLSNPIVFAVFPLIMSLLLLAAKGQILRLPSALQPFVPIVLAGVPVALAQYETIGIAAALIAGAVAGLEAIGMYHAAGKVRRSMTPPVAKTIAAATVVSICCLTLGCAASFEESKLAGMSLQTRAAAPTPSARCLSLDSAHRTWGGVGKGAAVLAGAEGIATWPADGERAELGLAIGAGVTAAVAATAVYVSEDYAAAWTRECAE
jgi:hypothetical protein